MPGKTIAEWRQVEVAVTLCLVGGVQAQSEVEAQHQEIQVVAHAEPCIECQLFAKIFHLEQSAEAVLVLFREPHIPGIDTLSSFHTLSANSNPIPFP